MINNNEIPKYRKSTESDISKSNRKAKHKHHYEECLIQHKFLRSESIITSLYSYCTICGKIGDRFRNDKSIVKDYRKLIDTPIGKCYSLITSEELYEKYYDMMPVFFVKDIYKEKYVNLKQNCNSSGE